jgi:uncharacterized protein (TIGR02646 family)
MSISRDCNIKQIHGRILLSEQSKIFINGMPSLQGHEWDGSLARPPWAWGDQKKVGAIKNEISECLKELQGNFCAYCGMPFEVTSSSQIEHIAPKGNGRYPQFMFHVSNLVHACSLCNGFEKKEKAMYFNTIGVRHVDYEQCYFNIVHPYLDDPDDHYDLDIPNSKVLISHKTLQGQKSIAVFKLAEEPLTAERGKLIMEELYGFDPIFRDAFEAAKERRGY